MMNSLLDLDRIREQPWYDEWWIRHGYRDYIHSMHRSEQEAVDYLAELKRQYPNDDTIYIQHIHVEEDEMPFSLFCRPYGDIMYPIGGWAVEPETNDWPLIHD